MTKFIIIYDLECEGIGANPVAYDTFERAREEIEVIKKEYANNGVGIHLEFDTHIIFDNDDEYKIIEMEC